jgi:hypothetical protein
VLLLGSQWWEQLLACRISRHEAGPAGEACVSARDRAADMVSSEMGVFDGISGCWVELLACHISRHVVGPAGRRACQRVTQQPTGWQGVRCLLLGRSAGWYCENGVCSTTELVVSCVHCACIDCACASGACSTASWFAFHIRYICCSSICRERICAAVCSQGIYHPVLASAVVLLLGASIHNRLSLQCACKYCAFCGNAASTEYWC